MQGRTGLLHAHLQAGVRRNHSQNMPGTLESPKGILHDEPHFCMLVVEASHYCHVWTVHVYFPEWCFLRKCVREGNKGAGGEGEASHETMQYRGMEEKRSYARRWRSITP